MNIPEPPPFPESSKAPILPGGTRNINDTPKTRGALPLLPDQCPECGTMHPKKFADGSCWNCFNGKCCTEWVEMSQGTHLRSPYKHPETGAPVAFPYGRYVGREDGLDYYYARKACTRIPKGGKPHILKLPNEGRQSCLVCAKQTHDNPRAVARREGKTRYLRDEICEKCSGRERRVSDNACVPCGGPGTKSARAVARRAGERMYTPTTPCDKCATTAPRRVDNNACDGCKVSRPDGRETAASAFMRTNPDLVIDRPTARLSGLAVYRTGKPCAHNHTAYRYVSTGSCIACLRGVS